MVKRHFTLTGILVSIVLLFIAASLYPGGSQHNPASTGYDWQYNYLCNLFNEKAMNGLINPGRYWAIAGMFTLCLGIAVFFLNFSQKMNLTYVKNTIAIAGVGAMFFAFLIVTPLHDLMTIVASTFALVALLFTTVMLFQSGLTLLKILSIVCVLILFANNYIYYSSNGLKYLPVLQKISFMLVIGWILGLQYFSTKEDYLSPKINSTVTTL